MDQPTADPNVVLEERRVGYARYRDKMTGARWEVHGECNRRGTCLIGSTIQTPDGPVTIEGYTHLVDLVQKLGKARIDSELDVPVAPGFSGCCPFTFVELEPAVI